MRKPPKDINPNVQLPYESKFLVPIDGLDQPSPEEIRRRNHRLIRIGLGIVATAGILYAGFLANDDDSKSNLIPGTTPVTTLVKVGSGDTLYSLSKELAEQSDIPVHEVYEDAVELNGGKGNTAVEVGDVIPLPSQPDSKEGQ